MFLSNIIFLQFFLCFFEIRNHDLVGGWATPLKNMKVNWDDEIPNISGKIKNGNQTTNQFWSVMCCCKKWDIRKKWMHDSRMRISRSNNTTNEHFLADCQTSTPSKSNTQATHLTKIPQTPANKASYVVWILSVPS